MIVIRKNPNFSEWYQVICFGKFLDEFRDRANALHFASTTAKKQGCNLVNVEGEMQKI